MYYVCRPSPCGGNGRADIAKIRHMPHLGRKRFGNTPRFPGALVSQVCSLASAGVLLRWHRFATGLVVLCPETPGRTSLRDMPSRARQGDGRSRMSLAPLGPGTVVRHRLSFEPLLSSGDWAGGMVLRVGVTLASVRIPCGDAGSLFAYGARVSGNCRISQGTHLDLPPFLSSRPCNPKRGCPLPTRQTPTQGHPQ